MSTAPEETYLARTFDDDRYAWARSRRVRHRAVVAEVALFVALLAATVGSASTDQGWTTWFFIVWTAGMLAFIPMRSVLDLGIRGVLDRDRRSLDEHQRRLGERSHSAMGRPSMALTFVAIGGAVAVVALTGHVAPALCLGFLLWLASGLLTYWHLAWTTPEEPVDTEI
ncbi:hypothetical protein [Blastococcus goldschmidtiae]|uniref:Uncharacterized protein n=1 Tax=Blastococcus goldschmidtiae TaxID=3075546 RepID=A0ABU2K6Z8_9ACTN|nr:hypothetical protein [Blastococcus sp. DSM 46792]MDT0275953.1 hypothetical protein [Blastococcus sp. DSM 46792]